MSRKLTDQVWEMNLPSIEKFVLLCLAKYACDEGECWPKQSTIAAATGYSERRVKMAIAWLRKNSLLTSQTIKDKTGKKQNRYRLSLGNHVPHPQGEQCAPTEGNSIPPQGEQRAPTRGTVFPHKGNSVPPQGEQCAPLYNDESVKESVKESVSEPSRACEGEIPPGVEDYITMEYPPYITALAIRFAELRRRYSNAKRVGHDAIDYYSGLITSILIADEYDEASLELLLDWFANSSDGQNAWTYGMSSLVSANIHKNTRSSPDYKQHTLIRNIASYLGQARDWKSGKSKRPRVPASVQAYHARVTKTDPSKVRWLTPEEREKARKEAEEIPY